VKFPVHKVVLLPDFPGHLSSRRYAFQIQLFSTLMTFLCTIKSYILFAYGIINY
jgi:hypothetical protein